jgi:hypothetical protein
MLSGLRSCILRLTTSVCIIYLFAWVFFVVKMDADNFPGLSSYAGRFFHRGDSEPISHWQSVPLSTALNNSKTPSPNAYVFYATSDTYACSALVNIDRLRNFATPHRIVLIVNSDVSDAYLSAFMSLNVTVIEHEVPPLPDGGIPYYESCLLKLVSFNIHNLIPKDQAPLDRVLVLDADQLILKPLDHLFLLPEVDLAAPRAYWLPESISKLTSTLMCIKLSDQLWSKVDLGIKHLAPDKYDMDLVNQLFAETAMELSGSYVMLNSHWEDWNLPDWYLSTLEEAKAKELSLLCQNRTAGGHEPLTAEAKEKLGASLQELYLQGPVLHFTAVAKPWSYSGDEVQQLRPQAHSILRGQFEEWREAATRLCPEFIALL